MIKTTKYYSRIVQTRAKQIQMADGGHFKKLKKLYLCSGLTDQHPVGKVVHTGPLNRKNR